MTELSNPAIDVVIVAADPAAALHFYGEVLGFVSDPVVHVPGGEASVHKFQVGNSRIRVVELKNPPTVGHPDRDNVYAASGYRMFTLHVTDVDAVAARCAAAQAKVTGPFELRPGVRLAVVHDPDGNAIEVIQAG